MPLLSLQRLPVAFLGLFEVFDLHVFVAAQRVSVGEEWIQLNGSAEEFERSFVLFLESVAVAEDAPGLRSLKAALQGVVGDVAEIHLLPKMPEARRIIFQALQSVRLLLQHRLVHFRSLCVLRQLEVAAGDLRADPGRLQMGFWQFLVHLDGFGAPVVSLHLIRLAQMPQKSDQVPVVTSSAIILASSLMLAACLLHMY